MNAAPQKASRSFASTLLLFALFSLPLVINPVVAMSFDEVYLHPKLLWIYAVVLPASLLVIWEGRAHLRWTVSTGLLAALAGWLTLVSLAVEPFHLALSGPADRGDGLLMHLTYVGTALAGWIWWQTGSVNRASLLRFAAYEGGLLALTNILQQLHLMGIPGEGAWQGVSATLLGGFQGNRGYLGGTVALLLPLVLSGRFTKGKMQSKLLFLSGVLLAWALIGSVTRGAWLSGALGLLTLAWWGHSRGFWKPVLTGLALFAGSSVVVPHLIEDKYVASRSFGQQSQALTDSSGRGGLWSFAFKGVLEKPVLGWGTPALWRVMTTIPDEELLRENQVIPSRFKTIKRVTYDPLDPPEFRLVNPDGKVETVILPINKVHNEYLDYALTYGVPAALLFMALLGRAIWTSRLVAPGIAAALVAYGVYLATWPEIIRFAPLAWFLLGVALAAGEEKRKTVHL